MKKVLLYIVAYVITFTVLAITQPTDFTELLWNTAYWTNAIAVVIYLVWLIICDYKRLEWKEESIHRLEVLRGQTEDKDLLEVELKEANASIKKYVGEIDTYNDMWEQMKREIRLGDKVKNTITNRTGIVYAMRIGYVKLSEKGQWHDINKFRKID